MVIGILILMALILILLIGFEIIDYQSKKEIKKRLKNS
jgi:uncharacterized protein YneF (UPF0154 family)